MFNRCLNAPLSEVSPRPRLVHHPRTESLHRTLRHPSTDLTYFEKDAALDDDTIILCNTPPLLIGV
jgi:hypothetical protein